MSTVKYLILLTFLAILSTGCAKFDQLNQSQDAWERDRVVDMTGNKGQCTAVEVIAPSGKVYTLSARHCAEVSTTGTITLTTEQGVQAKVKIIAKDKNSDLLLLEKIGVKSVRVAKEYKMPHGKVHTMTHGKGFPSHRSEGELLVEREDKMLLGLALLPQDVKECKASGGKVQPVDYGLPGCVLTLRSMWTTAQIQHGSSGGPLFNEHSELVGIVSMVDPEGFSAMVTLADIQRFLKDK